MCRWTKYKFLFFILLFYFIEYSTLILCGLQQAAFNNSIEWNWSTPGPITFAIYPPWGCLCITPPSHSFGLLGTEEAEYRGHIEDNTTATSITLPFPPKSLSLYLNSFLSCVFITTVNSFFLAFLSEVSTFTLTTFFLAFYHNRKFFLYCISIRSLNLNFNNFLSCVCFQTLSLLAFYPKSQP